LDEQAPVANGGRPGRPEGPIDPAAGAVANLAARLRQLREDAGRPSYRQLERTAYYSHSALSQAAAGRVLPSLAVTLAFAQACGGDRQEWIALWHEAAAEAGVPADPNGHAPAPAQPAPAQPAPAEPAPAEPAAAEPGELPPTAAPAAPAQPAPAGPARRGIRARLALVRRGGWYLLAAAGLAGGLVWWGLSASVTAPPATRVIGGLAAPVADGAVASVADCTSWTRDLGSREVLAGNGQVLGMVQVRYSMRCAAVWARFDADPALPAAAAGAMTITLEVIRHPDGKTMTYHGPHLLHWQRTDLLLLHGGCAQATVTVAIPGRTPVSAATGCPPPP
jgi:hypothetical protein